MKHARQDYNRIQDPAIENPELLAPGTSPIAEDEPVFLLRAKDKFFATMLMRYAQLVNVKDPVLANTVMLHIQEAEKWQQEHGVKHPDLPRTDY